MQDNNVADLDLTKRHNKSAVKHSNVDLIKETFLIWLKKCMHFGYFHIDSAKLYMSARILVSIDPKVFRIQQVIFNNCYTNDQIFPTFHKKIVFSVDPQYLLTKRN